MWVDRHLDIHLTLLDNLECIVRYGVYKGSGRKSEGNYSI